MIMRLAPIGAFGAMAFTVGRYGIGTLLSLGKLMAGVYITCVLFVFVVLGAIAALCGFSLLKFLRYISEEILIVLGTSSSESALPRMMAKLEHLGCSKPVVGLVVPTGYSFNLDGTSIYMTMAAVFVAQATGRPPVAAARSSRMLGVLLLTSKGAAAVTGSGFITLAATLAAFPHAPGRRAGAAARRRSLHVRGARDHQPDRQRRGDDGRGAVGRRAGSAARAADPGSSGHGGIDAGNAARGGPAAASQRGGRALNLTP